MIQSKLLQRFIALCLVLCCGTVTIWNWHTALTEGFYYGKIAVLFPGLAVMAMAPLFFPIDVKQLREQYGVDRPRQFTHYPPAWKVLFLIALVAALGNWFAIANLEAPGRIAALPTGADQQAGRQEAVPQAAQMQHYGEQLPEGGLWFWTQIGLLAGGLVLLLFGALWHKAAKVARFFGKDVNTDRAFWVMMIGIATLGIGLASLYFQH